jgi:hypothetical protein
VIAVPPFDAGALQLTDAEAFPAVAVTLVGAPGTVTGTTALDGLDGGELPLALVAIAVKVKVSTLFRPVIVHEVAVVVVQVSPPLLDTVAAYEIGVTQFDELRVPDGHEYAVDVAVAAYAEVPVHVVPERESLPLQT